MALCSITPPSHRYPQTKGPKAPQKKLLVRSSEDPGHDDIQKMEKEKHPLIRSECEREILMIVGGQGGRLREEGGCAGERVAREATSKGWQWIGRLRVPPHTLIPKPLLTGLSKNNARLTLADKVRWVAVFPVMRSGHR